MENIAAGTVAGYAPSSYTDIPNESKDRRTCAELLLLIQQSPPQMSQSRHHRSSVLAGFVEAFDLQTRGAYLYAPIAPTRSRAYAPTELMETDRVAVFDKDSYRAIGHLGVHLGSSATGEDEFVVLSDSIDNGRIGYGIGHKQKVSKHRKVALKTAAAKIRTPTPYMLLQQVANTFVNETDAARYATQVLVTRARSEMLAGSGEMAGILMSLHAHHKTGSPPPILSTERTEKIKTFIKKSEEDAERITTQGNETVFVNAFNLENILVCKCDMNAPRLSQIGSAYTCTVDELPESIEGKLAVLAMVDAGTYITGVGMKLEAATSMFFLENTENVHGN
jgi:hypothetical protein